MCHFVDAPCRRRPRRGAGEGKHAGHHDDIDGILSAGVEDGTVRLSANADVAVLDETEDDGQPLN